jgi:hypothetical protein
VSVTEDGGVPEADRDLERFRWLSESALSALSRSDGSSPSSPNDMVDSCCLDRTERNAAVWMFGGPTGWSPESGGLVSLHRNDTGQWLVTAAGGTDFSTNTWDDSVSELGAWSWSVTFADFDPLVGGAALYGRLPEPGSEVEFGFGFIDRCKTVTADDAGRFLVLVDVSQGEAGAFRSFANMRQESPHPILRLRTPDDRTFDLRNGWSVKEVR